MAIKKGDKIKVDYEGKLDDGTIFDSSKHGDHSHPLEFEVGSGQIIKGFDDAVVGMNKGEEKDIKIKPTEAYGNHNPKLVKKIPRGEFPKDKKLEPEMALVIKAPDGNQFPVKITGVTDKEITIDLNHPLTGKNLNFKIKIIDISKV